MMVGVTRHTVVSLFSGLGGLDLGFQWEGFQIIWANDLLAHAVESYRLNFDLEPLCADINQIPAEEIPEADVIIGGPPCQSFSLMGQRDPDDPRGRLVFRFMDIVRDKRPRAFVMENVPGMAASRINGRRLPDILREGFIRMGYKTVLMELMATDYLVPQRRKRLVLFGCTTAVPEKPDGVAFARDCYGVDFFRYDNGARAAIGDLGPCSKRGSRAPYGATEPSLFARMMRAAGLFDVSLHEEPRMSATDSQIVKHIPPGGNYRNIPDDVSPGRVLRYKKTGGRTTTYGRLHPLRPAYTINTYFRRPNVGSNFHYSEQRLITAREAMRFQSIPDHFELSFTSQDQRNALIGNAVPPLMSRAIAWALRKTLDSTSMKEGPADGVAYLQTSLL